MTFEERKLLLEVLEHATEGDLVDVAALVMVTAERKAEFCRTCGIRIGLRHDAACQIAEIGETVDRGDTLDVEEAINRRAIELRGEEIINGRRPLPRITGKVIPIRPFPPEVQ